MTWSPEALPSATLSCPQPLERPLLPPSKPWQSLPLSIHPGILLAPSTEVLVGDCARLPGPCVESDVLLRIFAGHRQMNSERSMTMSPDACILSLGRSVSWINTVLDYQIPEHGVGAGETQELAANAVHFCWGLWGLLTMALVLSIAAVENAQCQLSRCQGASYGPRRDPLNS